MPAITNRRMVPTEGADFYPTPAWGTKLLLHFEHFQGSIIEPCCGDGAMAKEIQAVYGDKVSASDLYDRGYGETGVDVFSITDRYNNFITNPPFNIASDVLEHALSITDDKVCLLLRTAFVESADRYERFFRTRPPARVWTFSERLSMYPANSEVQGGGTTSYSWFVFTPKHPVKNTELRWFPTGFKPKKGRSC